MRLALAQLNALVGDLEGNGDRLLAACHQAAAAGADLVVSSELSLWGYPPRDLLLQSALIDKQTQVLERLVAAMPAGLGLLLGIAEVTPEPGWPSLYNAVALVEPTGWRVVGRKRLLPSYDVFDERRYFRPGQAAAGLPLERGGHHWRLGLTICEDLWVEDDLHGQRLAGADPVAELGAAGIDLLLNLSASPFGQGKGAVRRRLATRAAARLAVPVVYVNQIGGNDELVFDGSSFVINAAGGVELQLPCAAEAVACWQVGSQVQPLALAPEPPLQTAPPADPREQLFRVLVLGLADYGRKCGFQKAVLGLSGGIDSALVAVLAAAAFGANQVAALLLPSPWSSWSSIDDAQALAQRLALGTCTLPIAPLMAACDQTLEPALGGAPTGLAAENLQSRLRGLLLMALANQQGRLLLATGNKSELAVGYCTLYGDMNGGLAVIGDLYKTTVFSLCEWLDSAAAGPCRRSLGLPAEGELIGAAIRIKAPSAELRPDQKDTDSLPDYTVLDPILKRLVEDLISPEQLVAEGADAAMVQRIWSLLRRAEFKRRQAAPSLKVSSRSFGSGWRMPIAAF
ncbi:MAG: NAD+ synthase [Cyanobacteriota bacterium]